MGANVPRLPPVFPAPPQGRGACQLQAGGIGVSVENPYYSHEVHGDYNVVSIGRLALSGIAPTYMPQIDQHLGELLATKI